MDNLERELEIEKLNFNKEKFRKKLELKNEKLKYNKLKLKKKLWLNPTFIAIIVAIIGLFGNIMAAYKNNESRIEIENRKAEAARILEALKVQDPAVRKNNLEFLLETGLIRIDSSRIRSYLNQKESDDEILPFFGEDFKIGNVCSGTSVASVSVPHISSDSLIIDKN